jgi:hypothetical protein
MTKRLPKEMARTFGKDVCKPIIRVALSVAAEGYKTPETSKIERTSVLVPGIDQKQNRD